MDSSVIVAIVSGLFTLLGSFAGVMTSHNLTAYRLQKLEEKVEKHNQVVERTAILEVQCSGLARQLEELGRE